MHAKLEIVIFGKSRPRLEDFLVAELKAFYAAHDLEVEVNVSHYASILESLDETRQQHASGSFLNFLDHFNPNEPEALKLGIVEQDLFSDSHPGFRFIFGEARVGGESCVISVSRLDPQAYGLKFNGKLYKERALKESLHELGHVLGLDHCDDQLCVMHFSDSIYDTDLKRSTLCTACDEKLTMNAKKRKNLHS